MENKQFSTKNPLRILFLIDQSFSTSKHASDDKPICEHFANAANTAIKKIFEENSDGKKFFGRVIIGAATFNGEGINYLFEDRLSNFSTIPCITPATIGNSPLGLALESIYNKCDGKNEFYHIVIVFSDAKIKEKPDNDIIGAVKTDDEDYELALRYAQALKDKGTKIYFAHMTDKDNKDCENKCFKFPSDINCCNDFYFKIAFELASEMDDYDRMMAKEFWCVNLPAGAKWMIMNTSDPQVFLEFIVFGSNSRMLPVATSNTTDVIEVNYEDIM